MLTIINQTATGPGISIGGQVTVDSEVFVTYTYSVPAGTTGTLTTRTDANTGTITASSSGHGIATGERFDIHWVDANGVPRCQYKVTAGTVSGASIPFDSGVGDDLPIATYAVVVSECVQLDQAMILADMEVFAVGGTTYGKFVLEKADGTVVYNKTLGTTGFGEIWYEDSGATNPVTDAVAKAFLSNGSSSAAHLINAFAGLSG